ncbi:Cell cycle checkpoint protein rad17 [Dermatophagoides farinae]|uniref:Cell cycle checkpoint protein rad17 n=1 Tax=Dermatophagoides farinae TaxID=6954 RepID=A0A922LDI1_DERFA|nr:Cell cycle checkpoint protein rad17 [Dermatophagoides farinae]
MSRWKKGSNSSPLKNNKSQVNKLVFSNASYSPTKRTFDYCNNDDVIPIADNIHQPESSKELAVSKAKLNELKDWMMLYFDHSNHQTKSPFLLLNGPSGSGKTITLKVLARELRIKIEELPVTSMFDNYISTLFVNDDENTTTQNNVIMSYQDGNQMNRMKKFLNNLNRYRNSIYDIRNNKRKILIIKEIPGIFLTKPDLLHEELKSYKMKSNQSAMIVPIVFIISSTAQGENLEQKILPKHIMNLLNFKTITFKPISDTCLSKVIENFPVGNSLNRSQIQEIISVSSGDVRHALNYLQFKYSSSDKNVKRTKKLKYAIRAPRENVNSINCDRNDSLTLSHAIAKILYAKRLETSEEFVIEYIRKYPNCDKSKLRNPLKECKPDEIAELANISYDQLIDWVYENYQDFIHDPYDLEKCSNCLQALCDSTYSGIDNYSERDSFQDIQTSIAIRGMLFNLNGDNYAYKNYIEKPVLSHEKKINQFRSLNPPKTFNLNKILTNYRAKIADLRNSNPSFFQFDNEKNLILDIIPEVQCFHKYFSNNHPHLNFINQLIDFRSLETNSNNCLVSTTGSSSLMEIIEQDDIQIEDDSD